MNKKEFSPYIRTAMLSVLKAPFNINDRVIFDYEIILVSGGRCRITIGGVPYLCKKNDVVFIRPGILHKFECVENSDFVQPHIHFDVIYTENSEITPISYKTKEEMSDSERSLISRDVFADIDIPDVFVPYEPEKFRKIFFEIINLYQEKKYNYELKYKSKMLELISCILSQFEGGRGEETDESEHTVTAVKNYIDSNYQSIITLDMLSEQFYINKFSLMRKFRAMYRQNPISYYRNRRLDFARKMLKNSNLSVKEIGDRLSFSDVYSFSRFFKSAEGIPPREYRRFNE